MNFTYDFDLQVPQISYGSGATNTFATNGDGQRVQKVDSSGATNFVYDGSSIVGETDATGTITAYYTPGIGFVYPAGTKRANSGQSGYYQENARGDTLVMSTNTALLNRYLLE